MSNSDIDIEKISSKLVKYDLIGISSTTPAFQMAVSIAQVIKNKKDVPILLGGHHATFMHRFIVEKYDCFDAIIRGEGETTIVTLCKEFFEYGAFINALENVTYRNYKGKISLATTIATENNLDCLPFPARDNFDEYFERNNGIVTISTTRGCPSGCSFCSSTNVRKNCATRSPKNIAEEVYQIFQKKEDFKIAFVDDNFYMNPEKTIQIISEIQEKCKRKFKFIFATRADQVLQNGEDKLKSLKDLGCIEIEMGIENGSDSVLQRYNKHITTTQNELAIKMIREQNIRVAVDYVLFDPEIKITELKENIQFMKKAKLWGYDSPLIYEKVVAFPGTDFTKEHYQLFHESCYIPSEIYFMDSRVKEIYDYLQLFRLRYQTTITKVLTKMRNTFMDGIVPEEYKQDYLWLKLVPYLLFEKLVLIDSNYRELFNSIIQLNNIPERLEVYKKQWDI